MWTIEPCIRYCDICKDFRVEIRAIHSRNQRLENKKWHGLADPARLEYLFVIQMFLVFVFYQACFFFPYKISAQEYA
jgi:hypothetical protein